MLSFPEQPSPYLQWLCCQISSWKSITRGNQSKSLCSVSQLVNTGFPACEMISTNCLPTRPSDTVPSGADKLADGNLLQLSKGFCSVWSQIHKAAPPHPACEPQKWVCMSHWFPPGLSIFMPSPSSPTTPPAESSSMNHSFLLRAQGGSLVTVKEVGRWATNASGSLILEIVSWRILEDGRWVFKRWHLFLEGKAQLSNSESPEEGSVFSKGTELPSSRT